MGAVLGLCSAAQLACCCGSAACSLCCTACPSCRNSTSSRVMYALLLLVSTIAACITLSPGLQDVLRKVPFCANSSRILPDTVVVNCNEVVGYLAVYRICFVVTCFFILMGLIMIGVRSSKDGRAGIQNGFWGLKYLLIIAGIIGSFFIPEDNFGPTWMYFGLFGGFLFILVQLILLVDFAHSWADAWVGNYEETESKGWYYGLLGATFFNYGLTVTGIVLLYTFFTRSDDCALNTFFISINMVLCLIVSVISIMPRVQEHLPRSGLLQSSVVSLYVTYLTWSTVSNSPESNCNPGLEGIIHANDTARASQMGFDKESIIGLGVWMACVLYSSLRSASSSSKITMTEHVLVKDNGAVRGSADVNLVANEGGEESGRDVEGGKKVWDNEEDEVAYNWTFFHIMFALATLYIMMTLTNWYKPNSSLKTLNANYASLWVKGVSSWLCIGLYGWSLIAPMVLSDRAF